MMVGTKAIATLSTGYLNALDYAKKRVQGADLTQMIDKTAPRVTITHHPDVRRIADAAEGVRRGHARAGRSTPRTYQDADRPGRRAAERRGLDAATWPSGSTTCCCRSSRASARSGPTSCSAPSRCRPSAAPASCRTTRSSSTSATPRSTPSTRARPRSRAWTSSSARSSATRARRSTHLADADRRSSPRATRAASLATRARAAGQGARGRAGHRRLMVGALMTSDPREAATSPTSTRSARTPPGC